MVRLVATPALDFAPETIGDVAIAPAREGRVTSLAPFRGRGDAIAAALDAIGLGWPGPDRRSTAGAASIHWAGRGRALLFREDVPDFGDDAAVIDMTGAEAVLTLDGPAARDVLARLIPVDLSRRAYRVDATARTLIGHMTGTVIRVADDLYELRVMRSMGGTLLHDVRRAARLVHARPLAGKTAAR